MKKAGYKTAAFGKWHLGDDPEMSAVLNQKLTNREKQMLPPLWDHIENPVDYYLNRIF